MARNKLIVLSPEERQQLSQKWVQFYTDYIPSIAPEGSTDVADLLNGMPLETGNIREDADLRQAWRDRTKRILDLVCPAPDSTDEEDGTHFFMEQYRNEPSYEFSIDRREFIERCVEVDVAWSQFYNHIYLPWFDERGGDYPDEHFTEFLKAMEFELDDDGYGDGNSQTYGHDSSLNGDFQARVFSVSWLPDWAREHGLDAVQLALIAFNAYNRGWSEPVLFDTQEDFMLHDYSRGSLICNNCGTHWDTENGGYSLQSEAYPMQGAKINDLPAVFLERQTLALGFMVRWLPIWFMWFFFYRWGKLTGITYGARVSWSTALNTVRQWHAAHSDQNSRRARWNLSPDGFFVGKHVELPLWMSYPRKRISGWLARQQRRFWMGVLAVWEGKPLRWLLQTIFIRIPLKLYRRWWDRVPSWYHKIFNNYNGFVANLGFKQLETWAMKRIVRLGNRLHWWDFWQRHIWVHLLPKGKRKDKLVGRLGMRTQRQMIEGEEWAWALDDEVPERGIILTFVMPQYQTAPLMHYHEWPPYDGKRVVGSDGKVDIPLPTGEIIHVSMYKDTHIKTNPDRPHFGYAYLEMNKINRITLQEPSQGPVQRFILARLNKLSERFVVVGDPFDEHKAHVRCPYCGHKHLEAYF